MDKVARTTIGPKDEYKEGKLHNGYDYENQAWVHMGKYLRCFHPEEMNCGCYGREHEGESCETGETKP